MGREQQETAAGREAGVRPVHTGSDLRPDQVRYYFRSEWGILAAVAVTGLIYNIGILAGPWFEGQLAGRLVDILWGRADAGSMLTLAAAYVATIAVVQIARYIKRFYVRRFANNVNRNMKRVLYRNLVHRSRGSLRQEGTGNVLTKAILDVDDCAEGMRKFSTEIFDTGVALIAYAIMLLWYDWRLGLLCMIFPPISYAIAEWMKVVVQRTGAAYKAQAGVLNAATLDRATNAITYRAYGIEADRNAAYERNLSDYEHSAIRANLWAGVMPPIYRAISLIGVVCILYYGARNVWGMGWATWDIAALTTYLSCYAKLAKKSSHAAKLFNAVHKAQVSWKRIVPFLQAVPEETPVEVREPETLDVAHMTYAYPGGDPILTDVSFTAAPGTVIGVTGPVACGKSTLGKVFLGEYPYEGSITYGGQELSALEIPGIIGYLGHDPELFNDTIENNVMMGDDGDVWEWLHAVCLDEEVRQMPEGLQTRVGSGGIRLSGGQAARLALARTLCHRRPVLVLDDPFAALDRETEVQVYRNLRELAEESTVILLSHRLYLFPEMDEVLWMEDGHVTAGTHASLLQEIPAYETLYDEQEEGGADHE